MHGSVYGLALFYTFQNVNHFDLTMISCNTYDCFSFYEEDRGVQGN